jgi:deoxycytidine triphosphate deaminase
VVIVELEKEGLVNVKIAHDDLAVRLTRRESIATLLFERVEEVRSYSAARELADLILERCHT